MNCKGIWENEGRYKDMKRTKKRKKRWLGIKILKTSFTNKFQQTFHTSVIFL